jgi:hypothetical protein
MLSYQADQANRQQPELGSESTFSVPSFTKPNHTYDSRDSATVHPQKLKGEGAIGCLTRTRS